jgi:uncharacterized protein
MSYQEEIESWRAAMEAGLRAEDGWLALAGLFWLNEGSSTAGIAEDCDVLLPAGSAPAQFATFTRSGGVVTVQAAQGVALLVNGEELGNATRELVSDMGGKNKPDVVTFGSLVMFVIQRGERLGLRLRDKQHPKRQSFEGRTWFPVQPEYRVQATFTAFDTPKTIGMPNILGDIEEQQSPGVVSFEWAGQHYQLTPTQARDRLFFVVRDGTSGHETYGMGRFLFADAPLNGQVILDFNQLHNPACAFTEYATCPLPPRENHLPLRIEAGELAGH